jgi:hypothetical protein
MGMIGSGLNLSLMKIVNAGNKKIPITAIVTKLMVIQMAEKKISHVENRLL